MQKVLLSNLGDWRSPLRESFFAPFSADDPMSGGLLGLHVVANLLTAIAYFSIPLMLIYFVRKRHGTPFSQVFVLFSAFIIACGVGHFLDVLKIWAPLSQLSVFEHALTAAVSCYTAIELYFLLPQFLSLKTPQELEEVNEKLQLEMRERQSADKVLNDIVEATAPVTGQDFFPALVEKLTLALNVKQIQIAEILNSQDPELSETLTLAAWSNPAFAEDVATINEIDDPAQPTTSYLRVPILDRNQQAIGILRVFHSEPTINREQATKIITVFASRAAAEIERKRALEKLNEANTQLANLNSQLEQKVTERTETLETVNSSLQEKIKQSRLTERALRESEDRFRSLLLNIPGAVFRCFPDEYRTMEFLSNRIEDITGYAATDFLNNRVRAFNELVYADDLQQLQAVAANLSAANATYQVEYRLTRCDGHLAWVFERGTGVFDANGQILYLEGVMVEITERKIALQSLEQERRQLRQLIQNMPVAMAMFDTQMRYVAYSDQWSQDYDLGAADLVGRSHYELFPELPEQYKKINERGLAGEVIKSDEDIFVQRDGQVRYLKWVLQPWYYSQDEVGGVVIVSQDIKDLVLGREAALEASRLKSSFLANMSHEIRTPMNGILGIAELLKNTKLSSQQQNFVQTLNNSAQHLLYLINDILDFSKLEAGEMRLEKTALDIVDCVESVAALLAVQAHNKRVELLTFVDPQLNQILIGDPVRLRQILTNLVNNAIKFTPEGSVVVRAILVDFGQSPEGESEVTVRIEITDTGIGIKSEDRHRLFQSFSQVDPSTTRQYGGTGLGLAIAKQLVTLMEGEIGIDSNAGEGSTFWFTAVFKGLDAVLGQPDLELRDILVIDALEVSRELIVEYLTAYDMSVDSSSDLIEGLVQIEQHQNYDLVLYSLPIFCGQQEQIRTVLNRLKDVLPREQLVVVISQVDYPSLKDWLHKQKIRHLIKPLQQQSLWRLLRNLDRAETIAPEENNLSLASQRFVRRSPEIKILLAEDTPVNQLVITNQLEILGFKKIDCASNGKAVLEMLQAKPYDLILMDCRMPELDGYDTTGAIRKQEKEGEMPVVIVAMTANALEGEREKCLSVGMNDYISKPTTIETLRVVLERVLDNYFPEDEELAIATESDQQDEDANKSDKKDVDPQQQAATTQNSPIDFQRLKHFYGEDIAFHRVMFKQLMSSLPQYLSGLEVAVAEEDLGQILYESHRLRGSVTTASIKNIPVLCNAIDDAAHDEDMGRIKILLADLKEKLNNVLQFLEDYLTDE
ncbi:ATP-binding protein [[Limnothrix rosea] IAM M-220]|uniref:ATP-binding protein n=1 Tax=[Limnothrix rosea] IAM M-220 TaxID=454133 RepID=UPI00095C6CA1|nr:ATP-binding protein [[Limnothrix rosea] IAM M-220]OKH18304.1 hypothetical protein NIES208_06165 [[Limnothrix rosea] IAM M-220]